MTFPNPVAVGKAIGCVARSGIAPSSGFAKADHAPALTTVTVADATRETPAITQLSWYCVAFIGLTIADPLAGLAPAKLASPLAVHELAALAAQVSVVEPPRVIDGGAAVRLIAGGALTVTVVAAFAEPALPVQATA